MSTKTGISWTDATWNPLVGCSRVSSGCAQCYAVPEVRRLAGNPHPTIARDFAGLVERQPNGQLDWTGAVRLLPDRLEQVLHWKKPKRIFVNSLSDLFHESVPFDEVDQIFEIMWHAHWHTFQVLTKRPERLVEYVRTRAYRRSFGWTDQERTPLKPGDIIHIDDLYHRNQCGYQGEARWGCAFPGKDDEDDSCSAKDCPIAYEVDERETLEAMGLAGQYDFDEEGLTTDTDWMRLHSRPKHAFPGNVWLGFSAEDQATFETRMRAFRPLRWDLGPHAILFASLEPLLGPITCAMLYWEENASRPEVGTWNALSTYDFSDGHGPCRVPYLNWVITGGESGPKARPCEIAWLRSVKDECAAAGVAFWVKQLGARPFAGHCTCGLSTSVNCYVCGGYLRLKDRKGGTMDEWPADLRVRQWPTPWRGTV